MRFTDLVRLPWGAASRASSRLGRSIEVILMFALAVQIGRLFWVMLSPPSAFGDWRPFEPAVPGPQARAAMFASFDPFYRQAPAGSGAQQITSLPFRLYGIRVNEGSGLGSAIIADDKGMQSSFAVGEEVVPGVTLKAVTYDHVVLSRNGVDETLYIDQSPSAPAAPPPAGDARQPDVVASDSGPPAAGEPLSSAALLSGIGLAPRTVNGAVTGIVLSPQGNGDAFTRAGFRPGDIVAQMNGTPIASTQDLVALKNEIKPGARLSLMIERGAATVPIAIIIPDNK